MAQVNYVPTQLETLYGHTHRIQWPAMLNTDTGQALEMSGSADRSVQVEGTFGGATATIQGTNEDVNNSPHWETLHDAQGLALTFTAAGIKEVLENTAGIRAAITGGDGTTSLTVTLCVRRPL